MEVVKSLSEGHKVRQALCLDFDGTIRKSKSGQTFIKNFQDIELIEGVEEIVQKYRHAGYLIFGVTNQGGVAHGFKLPMEIEAEVEATVRLFKENPFHDIISCYHDSKGTVEPYCHRSLLRKPDYGMLVILEYNAWKAGYIVDWDNSLFVGDRPEDEECARNAKVEFLHIDSFLREGPDHIKYLNCE